MSPGQEDEGGITISIRPHPEERVMCNQELVNIIVTFLAKGLGRGSRGDGKGGWKRHLVPLVLLSKNFFYASIDQLWNSMDSFLPFLSLLPSEHSPASQVLVLQSQPTAWTRFTVYASRTKQLVVRPDTKPSGPWISFLLHYSSCRPKPLFPRLDELVLTSADTIASMLLYELAPQLSHCVISKLERDEGASSFITAAAANLSLRSRINRHLTMEIRSPSPIGTMEYVSKIQGLQNLAVESQLPMEMPQSPLEAFNRIPGLKYLSLDYICPRNTTGWNTDFEAAIRNTEELPNLMALKVTGGGLVQHLVALTLRPSSLQKLVIVYRPSIEGPSAPSPGERLLFSVILLIHLERNKKLKKLVVTRQLVPGSPDDIFPADNIPQVARALQLRQHYDLFITTLSRASHLRELEISGIPFPDRNFILRVCDHLPNLPNLTHLTLRPSPLSMAPDDAIVVPSLDCLELIASCNPLLQQLNMPLDFTHIPADLPKQVTPNHPLSKLSLRINGGVRVSVNLRDIIALSRYLDTLFPNLSMVEPSTLDDPVEVKFWKGVHQLVRSYQSIRLLAAQDNTNPSA